MEEVFNGLTPRLKLPFRFRPRLNRKYFSIATSETPPRESVLNSLERICTFFGHNKRTEPSFKEHALVSALKFCSIQSAIIQGQQIHCLVFKSGLMRNVFVNNSLVSFYSKCGHLDAAESMFYSVPKLDFVSSNIMIAGYVKFNRLDDALKLFEIIPQKSCVSYTTIIMGLAQSGRRFEAITVFKDMMSAGILPNEVTLGSVLSAYSHLCGLSDGGMLHALVIKLGIEGHILVATSLIHLYSMCLSLGDARVLFEKMDEKNIVSWNVMLNGYSKAGLVELAADLFERIPNKDLISWGTMVDGYVQVDRLSEALAVYRAMLDSGTGPNDVMIVDLMSACGKLMAFDEGWQMHSVVVKLGFDCYNFVQSIIISFYSFCREIKLACVQFESGSKDHLPSQNALLAGLVRNGMIDRAKVVFYDMPERDVYSWSSMISGYVQTGQPGPALDLFNEMVACGVRPNEVTMVSVLSAVASSGMVEKGKWCHEYIVWNSIPLNDNLNAALIDMYAKCGSIDTALEMFYHIREEISSISPWNAIICGLAMHGHAKLSLKLFSELRQMKKLRPNSITFIGVLTACCHAGLVEEGKENFRSMNSVYGVDPNIKHYGCMVDLLGRTGRLEEAEGLVESMPMEADVIIWGTLLAACRTHGNVEVGRRAAESLAVLDKSHGASRVLLANIYANAGRWDDAFSVRRAMRDPRVVRMPGCSGVI